MSSIKPFRQFLEASDEFNLMKDLEDIGAKERTWTKEQVYSALEDVDWSFHFDGRIIDDDSFEYSFDERRLEVTASFMGAYVGEFDTNALWKELQSNLYDMKIDKDAELDEDEDFYTMDKISDAFYSVDYEQIADQFIADSDYYEEVEIDIEGRDRGGGVLDVAASATFDVSNIVIDGGYLVDQVIDNL